METKDIKNEKSSAVAMKINKASKRVETLNGFQLFENGQRVYSTGNKPTAADIGAVDKHEFNAIIHKEKWSRIARFHNTGSSYGGSFTIIVGYTRGSVVAQETFMCTFGHSTGANIMNTGGHSYSPMRVRLVTDAGNTCFFEVYGSTGGADFTSMVAAIAIHSTSNKLTVGKYNVFTDGTSVPSGYTARAETTTTSSTISFNGNQVYHTGKKPTLNDLTGKAVDSDKLDGLDSSQFLRSDTDDSFSGNLISTSRNKGIVGTYDSTKTDQIWSMGTAYTNNAAGTNFGNLYGLAYKHTNNTTGGTMAGGHQMVWCANGVPKAALGDGIWTSGTISENGQRVYSPNNKPTATDVGLSNVPNTAHTSAATANTVAVRDSAADINVRLLRSNYGNETRCTGAMAFRVNNTTDNYTRFCSDTGAIRTWLSTYSKAESDGRFLGKTATATRANDIVGHYIGGGLEKPNYFGGGKLRCQMLNPSAGIPGISWSDVVWVSGYTGSDVKLSNALIFSKSGAARAGFRQQNYDSTTWGTFNEFYHTGKKPTADDVGAIPKTGATGLSGVLQGTDVWFNMSGGYGSAKIGIDKAGSNSFGIGANGSESMTIRYGAVRENSAAWLPEDHAFIHKFDGSIRASRKIQCHSQGNDYHTGGVELVGNGSPNTVFPTLGFHQAGKYAASLQCRSAGKLSVYTQGGTVLGEMNAKRFTGESMNLTSAAFMQSFATSGTGGSTMNGSLDVKLTLNARGITNYYNDYKLTAPTTTGGWARGLTYYNGANTLLGGVGMLGSGVNGNYIALGMGNNWWDTASSMRISTNDVSFQKPVISAQDIYIRHDGRKHIVWQNANSVTTGYLYNDPNGDMCMSRGTQGGSSMQLRSNCLYVTGNGGSQGAFSADDVHGGSWVSWQSRPSALLLGIPLNGINSSAFSIWKATTWGQSHWASQGVHAVDGHFNNTESLLYVGNNQYSWGGRGFRTKGVIIESARVTDVHPLFLTKTTTTALDIVCGITSDKIVRSDAMHEDTNPRISIKPKSVKQFLPEAYHEFYDTTESDLKKRSLTKSEGVDLGAIVAIQLEAIKELRASIDILQDEIQLLKAA